MKHFKYIYLEILNPEERIIQSSYCFCDSRESAYHQLERSFKEQQRDVVLLHIQEMIEYKPKQQEVELNLLAG